MHCVRFIIPCAIVLSTINMNVIFRYSVRMQAGKSIGAAPNSHRRTSPSRRERSNVERVGNRNRTNIPVIVHQDNTRNRQTTKPSAPREQLHGQPPPPYSFDPPKSESISQHDSVMRLYEEIMASDSETIKVQQRTLETQQDVVRSQAQTIRQMRDILDMQDAQIVQLEDTITNLRNRRN